MLRTLYHYAHIRTECAHLLSENGQRRGQDITFWGSSPGHGERRSASLYKGLGAEPKWCSRRHSFDGGKRTPEAESSVAFEAPAYEPNLTHSDRFVFAKSVMFGG